MSAPSTTPPTTLPSVGTPAESIRTAVGRLTPLPSSVRVECLIAAALALTDVTEQGGPNHGQMVERFLHEVGLSAGAPWCAAFVHHVGYWSQFDPAQQRSAWPLPATGSCQVLGDTATAHRALGSRPVRGDVFLWYMPSLDRFAHTGIVLDVRETSSAFLCTTIEGNTNDDGGREGWKSCLKQRLFRKTDGHAFIHWLMLLGAAGTAAVPAGTLSMSSRARAA